MTDETIVVPISQLKRDRFQAYSPWPAEMRSKLIREFREGGRINVDPILDEDNNVLDGHQRIGAAEEAGKTEVQCRRVTGLSEDGKWRIALGQGMRRPGPRTRKEVREGIAKALLKCGHRSDGWISTLFIDCSDKLVRSVRLELVKEGKIPDHEFLLGLDGVEQPAHKPSRKKTTPQGEARPTEEAQQPGPEQPTRSGQTGPADQAGQEQHPPAAERARPADQTG
jgi:hypothetical protein